MQIAFKLRSTPTNISHLFEIWIFSFSKGIRNLVMVGCGAILWAIWKSRNRACFDKKMFLDPSEVTYICCFCLNHWAALETEKARKMLLEGSLLIRRTANEVFDWGVWLGSGGQRDFGLIKEM